jgi:inosine/xanthosine triphosphate pyrophosphatase family protein
VVRSLVLATRNPHKLREFERLLGPAGVELEPLPDGIELPPEDGEKDLISHRGRAARGLLVWLQRGTGGP